MSAREAENGFDLISTLPALHPCWQRVLQRAKKKLRYRNVANVTLAHVRIDRFLNYTGWTPTKLCRDIAVGHHKLLAEMPSYLAECFS
ncbi:hypothetical protein C3L21_01875 [Sinorhizobium meliloti]|nr:hypothetical protein C3L21_01875 [Sinorhizobium meliloti]